MSRAFESSAAGRLDDDAVLECGVCWWTYDPQTGDEAADIPAGVPFAALPEGWRCPSCDAGKDKFMVQGGSTADRLATPHRQTAERQNVDDRIAALIAAYEKAEAQIIGLPVHNPRLRISALGFQPHGTDHFAGIIITPWCMNLLVIPADPAAMPPGALGSSRMVGFPSGNYPFIAGRMEGFGSMESCSLFSPMDMFASHEAAQAAAQAALEGLYEAPEPAPAAPAKAQAQPSVSRRALLTGGSAPA